MVVQAAGQLASKMRFLSAPWCASLTSDVWLENTRAPNASAKRLEAGIRETGVAEMLYAVEANSVFLKLPAAIDRILREKDWGYYVFIDGGARLMCSWPPRKTMCTIFWRIWHRPREPLD